jgi:cytochrome c oxidase accessory protein FixG
MSSTQEQIEENDKPENVTQTKSSAFLQPEEHVLSTLEHDGSRRWLYPRLATGHLWKARRIVAWVLIAIFTLIPHLRYAGKPLVLLDIPHRRFTILGFTFLPTDTLLLALAMVSLFVTIFLVTALVGRVWCGWACPQTVYMEFLFRPIDRWFEGTKGKGGRPKESLKGWRFWGRFMVYLVLCMFLTHTFLAYFVGTEALAQWIRQSPFEHPIPFLVMAFTTGLMMFDFLFFREQLCLIACPYGRFQSVMLDRRSLIVAYDKNRGEPRTKGKRSLPVVSNVGDCIDCGKCVQVCPTGIDIRNGLQMECINCTQCIDVCNDVMDKVGSPRGLIRYSSQEQLESKTRKILRPRLIIYPVVLLVTLTLFGMVFASKHAFDATLLRSLGSPFTIAKDGKIENNMRLKLVNRTEKETNFTLKLLGTEDAVISLQDGEKITLQPEETKTFNFLVRFSPSEAPAGKKEIQLEVDSSQNAVRKLKLTLLAPRSYTGN